MTLERLDETYDDLAAWADEPSAPCPACGRTDAGPGVCIDCRLTCPKCGGAGEVQFNRSRLGDPQCEESARCGVCHGEGWTW